MGGAVGGEVESFKISYYYNYIANDWYQYKQQSWFVYRPVGGSTLDYERMRMCVVVVQQGGQPGFHKLSLVPHTVGFIHSSPPTAEK